MVAHSDVYKQKSWRKDYRQHKITQSLIVVIGCLPSTGHSVFALSIKNILYYLELASI